MRQLEFIDLISSICTLSASPDASAQIQLGIFVIGDLEGTLFFDEKSDDTTMMVHIKFGQFNSADSVHILSSLLEINLSLAKMRAPTIGALRADDDHIHLVLIDRIATDEMKHADDLRASLERTGKLAKNLSDIVEQAPKTDIKGMSPHMLAGMRRGI